MDRGSRTRKLCLLALVAGLLAVPCAGAAPRPIFGVHDDPETFAARADAAKNAGVKMARIPVSWERLEPWPGQFDFSRLDPAVAAVGSRGIRPLFVLGAAPNWAAPECDRTATPSCAVGEGFEDAYARMALELLQRYRGSQVQAWNEPNLAGFGGISAERVAELTNVLYRIAPRKVIGPAASPGKADYLGYTARAYRHINRHVPLAINMYPRSPFRALRIADDWGRIERIAGRRPIWVTEIGFATYNFGVGGQARESVSAYRFLAEHGARAIIFFCLQDPANEKNEWLGTLGLLSADGQPKPAFRALRRVAARFR
jgi:hypothetical protein